MKSFQYYLDNLKNLSTNELRTFNRYHLHPLDQRCCNECFEIKTGRAENFHIKKYANGVPMYNVKCSDCFNKLSRLRNLKDRHNIDKMIHKRCIQIKSRAELTNQNFNLTKEYLKELWESQEGKCYYTHADISFTYVTDKHKSAHYLQPALDKKDPSLGYVKGNVVWASSLINTMKHDCTTEEFFEIVNVINSIHNEENT